MPIRRITLLALAAVLGAAACDNSTQPANTLVADSTLTENVAVTSGDAIATSIAQMMSNESAATLALRAETRPAISDNVTVSRVIRCYDTDGNEVADCNPLSSVVTVVGHVSLDGVRNGSHNRNDRTVSYVISVHRVADDTTTRNFTGAEETSRTHDATASAHDTATFASDDGTLLMAEAAHDVFTGVTFDLPHANNPWPSAGTVSRVDTVHAEATQGSNSDSRTVVRNISVQFPADAQGNVTLVVGATECTLNLVTHAVTNCQQQLQ